MREMNKYRTNAIENASHCIYCSEKLCNPVPDHCHTTFRFRGMACRDCNLKARMNQSLG